MAYLNAKGVETAHAINMLFPRLVQELLAIGVPSGRALALVKTKLDEARLWAVEALTENDTYTARD